MLRCNGKCQLMKKMAEEKKNQEQIPVMKLAKWDAGFCVEYSLSIYHLHFIQSIKYPDRNFGVPVDRSFDFFHPPSLPA